MIFRIDDIMELAGHFAGLGRVFAPVRTPGGRLVWDDVTGGDGIDLSARTDVSARNVFQPATSYYLRFGTGSDAVPEFSGRDPEHHTVIGMRPCDVASLGVHDRVFSESERFRRMREMTLIVGLLCRSREDSCFCEALGGSPGNRSGMDLALYTDREGIMYLETVTEQGARALEGAAFPGAECTPSPEVAGAGSVTEIPRDIASRAGKADDSVWEEVSFPCFNCRVCTYVCPTCHCFTITDETFRSAGARAAVWDSCQSREFTLEASGHNPRETGAARARQRIMHKFAWYPSLSDGEIMCTGCGRCISACPAGRSIVEDLAVIAGEV
jgi:sulfhydrogenase subunit beta (sulfur reductase)